MSAIMAQSTDNAGKVGRMTLFHSFDACGAGTVQSPWAIVDLSSTGARLRVKSAMSVPETFELCVGGITTRRCSVVWRFRNEIGIRFEME